MTKEDFMFVIGYQGVSAIVDKRAKSRYSKLTNIELSEKGLFKSAFCAALYDENEEELKKVVEIYSSKSGMNLSSGESMKRLLGVFGVPGNITRVTYI